MVPAAQFVSCASPARRDTKISFVVADLHAGSGEPLRLCFCGSAGDGVEIADERPEFCGAAVCDNGVSKRENKILWRAASTQKSPTRSHVHTVRAVTFAEG